MVVRARRAPRCRAGVFRTVEDLAVDDVQSERDEAVAIHAVALPSVSSELDEFPGRRRPQV